MNGQRMPGVRTVYGVLLTTAVLTIGATLAGCAGNGPIIDRTGVDEKRYASDLSECRTYASEVSTGKAAGKSAIAGAVVGAAIGAITGNSTSVARGAGVGGVAGGASGAVSGEQSKDQVVKNCLRGRGYKVLN
ncbi:MULTISPECIES: glycine zipper family protein [Hydrocarboniphaga]|jgi:outer membrane lipoprotein SlyB|nr:MULTISPECIES: glycine zipper family protein [Hydrocarboniphaga]MDZ4080817.1 glycine zipper family protein [Hydrocarboniphaga sp.]MDZ4080872.1 glycine zipper family protein [Hydrocarboniphaga sp.]